MKREYIYLITLFTFMICYGCNKEDQKELTDLATKVSGTYNGLYTYICTPDPDQYAPATIIITRVNDSTVLLSATIANEHRYDKGVRITQSEYGYVELYAEFLNSSLYGSIEGNDLNYTIGLTNIFEGTKQ